MQQSTEQITSTSSQPVKTVYLFDLLQIIAKRSKLIYSVTLAAAIMTIIYSLFLPNIYTAKTLILPSQEDKGMMTAMMAQIGGLANLAGGTGLSMGSPTNAELYVSMLKSDAVKDPLIERFRLMEAYHNTYLADTYKAIDKNTAISAGRKDGIITITVDDKDPKRAAEMANSYVEELGKLAIRLNVTGAGQNRSFLEERLNGAKAALIRAEENLKAFQAKNKAVQVSAQAEATIKGVAEMRAQLAAQEVQLATYRRQFTERSQEVKNLVTSNANLRAQIEKLEGAGGSSAIPSVGSVPTIGQEYVRLMREFKIQESLVELLTKQYEMATISEAKDISPFQVILKAKVPERKSKPARAKMVLIASVVALLCSVVCAFVQEYIEKMPNENRAQLRDVKNKLLFFKKI